MRATSLLNRVGPLDQRLSQVARRENSIWLGGWALATIYNRHVWLPLRLAPIRQRAVETCRLLTAQVLSSILLFGCGVACA